MQWTEQKEQQALRMHEAGNTAKEIAAELGDGCTRSAVVGKIYRLRRSGVAVKAPAIRAGRTTAATPKSATTLPMMVQAFPEPVSVVEEVSVYTPGRVPLLSLRVDMCRWPIGDPASLDFGFCGEHTDGRVYCANHAQVAYLPSRTRTPAELHADKARKQKCLMRGSLPKSKSA